MASKLRISLLAFLFLTLFLGTLHLQNFRVDPIVPSSILLRSKPDPNHSIQQEPITIRHVTSLTDPIPSVSILLPDWEVLSLTPSSLSAATNYTCRFPNGIFSQATPAGTILSPSRTAFRCDFPARLRRRSPFPQPVLTVEGSPEVRSSAPELLRWDRLVYDSLTTNDDVILFAKGINRRQGSYRAPEEFMCVFGEGDNAVKSSVISSAQEVFRCKLPEEANAVNSPVKVSIEFAGQNWVVPSVAYYTPRPKIAEKHNRLLLCACTMVYNSAKFLKEWVVYHSSIGVDKFILYDNNSDDELHVIVSELIQQGYDVSTLLWIWPKTQEAGFSHSAIYAKDTCTWIMYTDIDEFVYSPTWADSPSPSPNMLKSMLPQSELIGQIMINCYEFGPSDQKTHPIMGVTQGYNYRRRTENRHKSIVLLDAIDDSLLNLIHHFKLKENYESIRLGKKELLVNHYKYQAWPEFRMKFRRRVSAYVADWTKAVNPASKDRAPGLGYAAVEPKGWTRQFCEVRDDRLKDLTKKWFTEEEDYSNGYKKMVWQQNTTSLF